MLRNQTAILSPHKNTEKREKPIRSKEEMMHKCTQSYSEKEGSSSYLYVSPSHLSL